MKTKKLDNFPAAYPDPDYLLGPFTMNAVCELLFRANEFTLEDAVGGYSGDPDELDVFKRMHLIGTQPYTYFPYSAAGFSSDWSFEFYLFETGVDPWTGHDDNGEYFIYDIAGSFYLRGYIGLSGLPGLTSNWSAAAFGAPTTVTFKLYSGDFAVTVFGDFSANFEISGWFPYKTSAGADAWNTATGAAANGGPGA